MSFPLVVLYLLAIAHYSASQQPHSDSIVDDCCCSTETVQIANRQDLNPLLTELVSTRFFRYFKVDLFQTCPFWVEDYLCELGGCSICDCSDHEVPTFWEGQCSPYTQLITDQVDRSSPLQSNFASWSDAAEDMWTVQGTDSDMSYVDLREYPEAYTGYQGNLIWTSIYNENCFKGNVEAMCLEERVFYRLISGLHASINTHLCRKFSFDEELGLWAPNIDLFRDRLYTHPERIKNMHFTFLFLLRAISKAAPVLKGYEYNTGNPQEDQRVKELVKKLLSVDLLCSPNFDESILFSDPSKASLRQQVKSHFRNISQIMDCVSCEKCKVYAKLQTLGLGTALKLLMEPEKTEVLVQNLQRNEIIALINTLRQLSVSINTAQQMSQMYEKQLAEEKEVAVANGLEQTQS